jgi:hypothetical protein
MISSPDCNCRMPRQMAEPASASRLDPFSCRFLQTGYRGMYPHTFSTLMDPIWRDGVQFYTICSTVILAILSAIDPRLFYGLMKSDRHCISNMSERLSGAASFRLIGFRQYLFRSYYRRDGDHLRRRLRPPSQTLAHKNFRDAARFSC